MTKTKIDAFHLILGATHHHRCHSHHTSPSYQVRGRYPQSVDKEVEMTGTTLATGHHTLSAVSLQSCLRGAYISPAVQEGILKVSRMELSTTNVAQGPRDVCLKDNKQTFKKKWVGRAKEDSPVNKTRATQT